MKTYICGRVTGLPEIVVTNKFQRDFILLHNRGLQPVSPVTAVGNPNADWAQAMAICLPLLFACQAIYVQKDWQESNGAKIEIIIASQLNLHLLLEDTAQRPQLLELIGAQPSV